VALPLVLATVRPATAEEGGVMQGQSEYTFFKEYRFTPILAQSLRISKAAPVAQFAYYHVDLNAGGGYNTDVGVSGSPLNFLSAAARNDRPNFYAFFVDCKLSAIRELTTRPEVEALSDRVSIFHADNSEVLPVVDAFIAARERRAECAMGSVLIDPNGYHKGVPWDALRVFCHAHPRMDVLMNLNARQFKLEESHIGADWQGKHTLRPVSTFPGLFRRPNWMLTEKTRIGGNDWIQLVGRTIRTAQRDYSSLGFYDLESERGQRIVADIEQPASRTGPQFPLLRDL
jgi:hypothetical protein